VPRQIGLTSDEFQKSRHETDPVTTLGIYLVNQRIRVPHDLRQAILSQDGHKLGRSIVETVSGHEDQFYASSTEPAASKQDHLVDCISLIITCTYYDDFYGARKTIAWCAEICYTITIDDEEKPMKAIVIMVNDYPFRVVAFDPNARDGADLERQLLDEQRAEQRELFARRHGKESDPDAQPFVVGHVHTHIFDLEIV